MAQLAVPSFAVVTGAQARRVLHGREKQVVDLVEAAYRAHGTGQTVNPPSYFLRFPDRPSSRIIALPASVGGADRVDGIKWISSFPDNVAAGIPRASAVVVLNDWQTGYPFACLEGSIISAARTAASATLAAGWLTRDRTRPRRVGFIGTGLIARYIHAYLTGCGWEFDEIGAYDVAAARAAAFADRLRQSGGQPCTVHDSVERLIRSADLVVVATVATRPHIMAPAWFAHAPVVLHISLRDLAPQVILAAANVVDDVGHCLTAGTSPHLAEQAAGHRDFLIGTLYDVMAGRVRAPADRPVVFSPFGLGALDMVVGKYVYDEVRRAGELAVVDGFFEDRAAEGRQCP